MVPTAESKSIWNTSESIEYDSLTEDQRTKQQTDDIKV